MVLPIAWVRLSTTWAFVSDHDGMRRKLDGLGIPYSRMELPELGERRLFIRTPTKILLELVFRYTKTAPPSVHQIQNQ